jgi:hypothetical protein
MVQVRRVGGVAAAGDGPVATQVTPAVEGLAEAPASAPLDLPPQVGPKQSEDGGAP